MQLAVTLFIVAAPGQSITMFDIDMANRILYYVSADNTIWKRLLDLPISDPAKERVVDANGQISGMFLIILIVNSKWYYNDAYEINI